MNLASVNYHFGSKKELIQAVLDRYLSIFMPALDARLQTLMVQEQLTLLQVFESFVDPLMKLVAVRANGNFNVVADAGDSINNRPPTNSVA